MRPRIVEYLNHLTGTGIFAFLVPDPALVYAATMAILMVVFVRRCGSSGLSRYHAVSASFYAMVAGLLGARIFYLATHIDRVVSDPWMVLDLNGATVSWGAYIGGVVAFVTYFARKGEPLGRYADTVASTLGLGPFIARWSCFLNGDDYGTLSSLPWAVAFPHGSYPFARQVRDGLLDPLSPLSQTVHPVQLYLALNGLILFLVFTLLWKKRALLPGNMFLLYWIAYGTTRFLIEFFRGDAEQLIAGLFTPGQLMSAIVVLVSGSALIVVSVLREHERRFEIRSDQAVSPTEMAAKR